LTEPPLIAGRLAARHFKAQAHLPEDLATVDLGVLDPFLRNLLVTDGTVSRSLEAHTLREVIVEPVEQSETLPPPDVARDLQLEEDEACMRRRVVMRISGPDPSVWAESYVVPGRAPIEFLRTLRDNSQGIGGSLEQLKLESWRELLWFGIGSPPPWPAESSTEKVLRRSYLILIDTRPALLIGEHFALAESDGCYGLAGADPEGPAS
jgi:chorismate-pyruvate lyase